MIDEILDYKFNNPMLLKEALTHPSICVKTDVFSYERLEFLGDAALSLVIADLLMHQFPHEDEGDLAKRRSGLVAGEVLTKIARNMNLGNKIHMTESEKRLGGEDNANNLENVLEALIGAIYLDGGIEKLKLVIKNIWQPYIDEMIEVPNDPKSHLQELLQKNGKALPKYELIDVHGPGHMLVFRVRIRVPGLEEVIGEGRTKRQAEKNAATLLLEQII